MVVCTVQHDWRDFRNLSTGQRHIREGLQSGSSQRGEDPRTLYNMTQTKRLSGIRKKLMMVARISSGTYSARIFIMLGQKRPTITSNMQKASSWIMPLKEMPARQ